MNALKCCIFVIISILSFSFADSEIETSIKDYESSGFEVKELNVVYVNSFDENENIKAMYKYGMIIIKKGSDSIRALRHEIAHAISLETINTNRDKFEAYRNKRMENVKVVTIYKNLTGDELGYVFKLLKWFYRVTTTEEIVAEDLYYYVYRLDTLQKDYIGVPTTENIEELLTLIDVNLIYLNKDTD